MNQSAADRARQERKAQGLPQVITDRTALARLARLVRKADRPAPQERAA